MSACDTCRSPGHCCHDFILMKDFGTKADARRYMRDHVLPFYPMRAVPHIDGWFRFDCHWIGDDGRCKHYEDRPQTCRLYEPLTDGLCIEHVPNFKGIPIAVLQ